MKILHFIFGKANPNRPNGVNQVIHGMAKYCSIKGQRIKVIGLSTGARSKYEIIKRDGFEVEVFNKFFGRCFSTIKQYSKDADIVHLHSVWHLENILIANYLISLRKPYVITVHSGLTDDRIRQSNYITKILFHRILQKRIFNHASGIHAITREERTCIAKYTSNKNIFSIPNGIDLRGFELTAKTYSNKMRKISFGYIGRFGHEKNIYRLLLAISQLPTKLLEEIKCYLIGPLDDEAKKLQTFVKNQNLSNCIIFAGELYGRDKYNFLADLDFYVHPAISDVVSIAVIEAMSCGLPCVITRTSQVSYYYKYNSFIMVEPDTNDLKRGLIEMIESRDSWPIMSQNAISLIQKYFNWNSASNLLINEYNKIIN